MSKDQLEPDLMHYDALAQEALRGVVKAALKQAASPEGIPGGHHFYITFRTRAPGVSIPPELQERYPEEMTIVLQHQFWDLGPGETFFTVTLKFGGQPKRLSVPYAAISRFYDPHVQFLLPFEAAEAAPAELETLPVKPRRAPAASKETTANAPPTADADDDKVVPPPSDEPNIVSLDQFREKMIARARTLLLALAVGIFAAAPAFAQTASPFSDWAAVIVAADWRAHGDEATEGFDNARRDLTKAFVAAGFSSANIVQFSTRPESDPQTRPLKTEFRRVKAEFDRVAAQAKSGCLAYFTSHGSGMGIVFGEDILTPAGMARLVDDACGKRPTVVVISACFSGVFLPAMSGPNRMVLTAARPDRTSFGCGQTDRYPYFDACMLESLPQSPDFVALGRRAQVCVAARERAERLTPPSEPQMSVGGAMRPLLPLYAFANAAPDLAVAPGR